MSDMPELCPIIRMRVAGYNACKNNLSSDIVKHINPKMYKAFCDGYASRYEEEQQLTHKTEEQENGR